ncbi:phosphoglycolate phosphatase, partial [Burkholderia pseudomallei]
TIESDGIVDSLLAAARLIAAHKSAGSAARSAI